MIDTTSGSFGYSRGHLAGGRVDPQDGVRVLTVGGRGRWAAVGDEGVYRNGRVLQDPPRPAWSGCRASSAPRRATGWTPTARRVRAGVRHGGRDALAPKAPGRGGIAHRRANGRRRRGGRATVHRGRVAVLRQPAGRARRGEGRRHRPRPRGDVPWWRPHHHEHHPRRRGRGEDRPRRWRPGAHHRHGRCRRPADGDRPGGHPPVARSPPHPSTIPGSRRGAGCRSSRRPEGGSAARSPSSTA